MSAVFPAPYVPYRAFDDDADPLAGGRLYAFEAGTDTPLATYHDPAGTVLNTHPVLLDDAGYGQVYLLAGRAYKLVLTDNQGVQQWEVDQVYGGGGTSGLAGAGIGAGIWTVAISPTAGTAQALATVFPPDVLALGLTLWIEVALGTSQGLTHVGIGTATSPDCWGYLANSAGQFAASTETKAGIFQGYGGQPHALGSEPVTLTAYGGLFDGTGTVLLTGHYLTLHPNTQAGASYLPGAPSPPAPPLPATETQAGVVELINPTEVLQNTDLTRAVTMGRLVTRTATTTRAGLIPLATQAEVDAGVNATEAVTPATLATRLAALPVPVAPGTAVQVPRYAPGGATLEPSPLTVGANGELATRISPGIQQSLTLIQEHTTTAGQLTMEVYQPGAGGILHHFRRATGTPEAPGRAIANTGSMNISGQVWARNPTDTADAWSAQGSLRFTTESSDAQGRIAGYFSVWTNPGGASAGQGEVLRVTGLGGNLLLGGTTHGTGLTRGVVVAEGVAPSAAHPADAVQVWVENLEGVAGAGALHVRSETGVTTRIGTGVLSRKMVLTSTTATVAAPYVITAEESGKVFIANNATERCQFTLPPPVVGLTYTFVNTPVQGMRIRTSGTGRIRLGGTLTIVGGALDTVTVGDTLILVVISTVIWQAIGAVQGFTIVA